MPRGASTVWHVHPVPMFAYILEGELVVDYEGVGERRYRKGDTFVEAIDWPHRGRAASGKGKDVKILVVYPARWDAQPGAGRLAVAPPLGAPGPAAPGQHRRHGGGLRAGAVPPGGHAGVAGWLDLLRAVLRLRLALSFWLLRFNRDLLVERLSGVGRRDQKTWDKVVLGDRGRRASSPGSR